MTGEQFYEVLGEVDEGYVKEARRPVRSGRPLWRKWAAVAACLYLAVAAVLAARTFGGSSRLISKYDCNRSASYTYPKPGTYFCFVDVNEARKHYAGRDVEFLLAFDLFKGEDGNERVSQEELQAEYQRLAGLGFRFYEVEAWTYRDVGVREYYTVVMGAFTEEQLADFPASPDYGYAFHFVHNGNGSSVRVDESRLITDFESHLI